MFFGFLTLIGIYTSPSSSHHLIDMSPLAEWVNKELNLQIHQINVKNREKSWGGMVQSKNILRDVGLLV